MDGSLASASGVDDLESIRSELDELVNLAERLERVLILPAVYFLGRRFPSWELLDTSKLNFRETSFLENPKIQVDSLKIARLRQFDENFVVVDTETHRKTYRSDFLKCAQTLQNVDLLFVAPRQRPLTFKVDQSKFPLTWPPNFASTKRNQCDYKHREQRKAQMLSPTFDCASSRQKKGRATFHREETNNKMLTASGREIAASEFKRKNLDLLLGNLPPPPPPKSHVHLYGVVPSSRDPPPRRSSAP